MQLNSVYLYPNKIDVFTNALTSWQTERYRKVYNRNLKVYRSVDNRIDLQVRNSDQKAASITGSTLVFNIITREGKDLILSKDCTTNSNTNGRAYVILTATELAALESGMYNYSVTQEVRTAIDGTDYIVGDEYKVTSRTPTYQDSQYGSIATLEVSGEVLGEAEQSEVINKFLLNDPSTTGYTDPKWYDSSIIDTLGHTQVAQSLHTFQIYSTGYTGTVVIQGSLSEGAKPNIWTDIETLTLTNASLTYQNVVGKYNFFRIRHYPTTGTVDKILYR
jgi:hypothetical protein